MHRDHLILFALASVTAVACSQPDPSAILMADTGAEKDPVDEAPDGCGEPHVTECAGVTPPEEASGSLSGIFDSVDVAFRMVSATQSACGSNTYYLRATLEEGYDSDACSMTLQLRIDEEASVTDLFRAEVYYHPDTEESVLHRLDGWGSLSFDLTISEQLPWSIWGGFGGTLVGELEAGEVELSLEGTFSAVTVSEVRFCG